MSLTNKLIEKILFKPVSIYPVIIFRIAFGLLMFFQLVTFLWDGTIYNDFINPPFTFTYIGFEFLQPPHNSWMYVYVALMLVLSVLITIGAWYRLSILGFAILWQGLYLMQKSDYNNHYYLITLLSWIMSLMPANALHSIDAKRNRNITSTHCPQYCRLVFVFQIAIVYFFSGISKLTPEWLSGRFINIRFTWLSQFDIFGYIYGQKWFQMLVCYSCVLFDLTIIPLLVWKKTRHTALIISCLFHLFNSYTFNIGIFPYLCICLNVFFLKFEDFNEFTFIKKDKIINTKIFELAINNKRIICSAIIIYLVLQTIIPLRSYLFPGDVLWTDEGYRMSWKLMMRTKTGQIYFKVIDPSQNKLWKVEPSKMFSPTHYIWLATSPDMIWQYVQKLKQDFSSKGHPDIQIYAIGLVSLNGMKPKPLVDSTFDLSKVKWQPFKHSEWVTKNNQ